jgi:5'-nucleotidase
VLRTCRNDVAEFHRRTCQAARTPEAQQSCEQALNPCELGGEACKFLACVDDQVGNFTDNRIIMVGK